MFLLNWIRIEATKDSPLIQLGKDGNLWVLLPLKQEDSTPYLSVLRPDGSLVTLNEFNDSLGPRWRTDGWAGHDYYIVQSFALDHSNGLALAGMIFNDPTQQRSFYRRFIAYAEEPQREPQTNILAEKSLDISDIDFGPIGELYITGSYSHNLSDRSVVDPKWSGKFSGYISKLSQDGLSEWTTLLGDSYYPYSAATVVNVANDGSVLVAGFSGYDLLANSYIFRYGFSSPQSFLACLEPTGATKWQIQLGEQGELEYITDMIISPDGSIYVTGVKNVPGSLDLRPHYGSQSFVSKYDQDGNILWNKTLGDKSTKSLAIALDRDGNVFVGGQTYEELGGSEGSWGAFVAIYQPSGNYIQSHVFGSNAEGYGHDVVTDLVIDSASNTMYVSGLSEGLLNWVYNVENQTQWIRDDRIYDGSYRQFIASISLTNEDNSPESPANLPLQQTVDIITGTRTIDLSTTTNIKGDDGIIDRFAFASSTAASAPSRIASFNAAEDLLQISQQLSGLVTKRSLFVIPKNTNPTTDPKSAKKQQEVVRKSIKKIGRTGDGFTYNQISGELFIDTNHKKKGFGEGGGLLAVFGDTPALGINNFEFL